MRAAVPSHLLRGDGKSASLGWDSAIEFEIADAVQQAGAGAPRCMAAQRERLPRRAYRLAGDRRNTPAFDYSGYRYGEIWDRQSAGMYGDQRRISRVMIGRGR